MLKSKNQKKTIVVAMSGGVDSSTVAAILQNQGYKVIGITLQLHNAEKEFLKKNTCCTGSDIYDAQMVASKLKIPHYVMNYESKFKKAVIDDFVDSYNRGETPLPCVRCNESIKFKDLLKTAKELGADGLATGHYIRKIQGPNIIELHTAVDTKKDQSYFLFPITLEQLDYLLFPLGEFTKENIRQIAYSYNLNTAQKPDSQDICFVPTGNYRDLIKINNSLNKNGVILHIDGFQLGYHNGINQYTIGQRKGLGISFGEALYVIKIDHIKNIIYVGPKKSLDKEDFTIKDINWIAKDMVIQNDLIVKVKLRSSGNAIKAKINKISNNEMKISLLIPEKAVTPGQACVIYHGTRMLGGGWIKNELQ